MMSYAQTPASDAVGLSGGTDLWLFESSA
jgi:hypothetical protein